MKDSNYCETSENWNYHKPLDNCQMTEGMAKIIKVQLINEVKLKKINLKRLIECIGPINFRLKSGKLETYL